MVAEALAPVKEKEAKRKSTTTLVPHKPAITSLEQFRIHNSSSCEHSTIQNSPLLHVPTSVRATAWSTRSVQRASLRSMRRITSRVYTGIINVLSQAIPRLLTFIYPREQEETSRNQPLGAYIIKTFNCTFSTRMIY